MQLTEHFSLAEMTRTSHRLIDNSLTPGKPQDDQIIEHLKILCQGLEHIRAALGVPILINSGFRCPALNLAVGSKPTSHHVLGFAADFRAPAFGTPLQICQRLSRIQASLPQWDQLIYERPIATAWVHISFAPRLRGQVLSITRDGVKVGLPPLG